jgi:hypothetical protein
MLQENIVKEGEKQRLRPCSHTSLRPPFPLPFFSPFSSPLVLTLPVLLISLLGLEAAAGAA